MAACPGKASHACPVPGGMAKRQMVQRMLFDLPFCSGFGWGEAGRHLAGHDDRRLDW